MKTIVIIPSRLSATRLPGKPLLKINGLSIISHVFKKAEEANIGEVIVATEDKEIMEDVKKNGGQAILTQNKHKTGTDRIFEALQKINISNIELVMNLQGDEPFIPSKLIKKTIDDYFNNSCDVITVSNNISSDFDITNPNCVLVETDNNFATSFIRTGVIKNPKRHIGIYGYSLKVLSKLVNLEPTENELKFKLEQLRFLENNFSIYVSHYEGNIPHGIDTEDDLKAAINYLLD